MTRKPARYCMRMVSRALPGDPRTTRTDVCGLVAGHEGAHKGQYHLMAWDKETVIDWGRQHPGKGLED